MAGAVTTLICLLGPTGIASAGPGDHPKLDKKLNERAKAGGAGLSRVIVVLKPGWDGSSDVKKVGGRLGRQLGVINGRVVELPNGQLRKLADSPAVESIHWDRPIGSHLNRAAVTVGARAVQQNMGYTGAGVGVAVIDSGITSWHDDLTYNGSDSRVQVVGGQRVTAFVDFVNGRTTPYDDYGHGTHVSGIIAGNGYDTYGSRAGIAPAADIVSLKVLDANGGGTISNVIAALDWAVTNKAAYNIRVINLSVGAAVTESYKTDPLTLAAKRAVDAGIVVVTAAGNLGHNAAGVTQYGGITAPGNAPWVLTVGASNTQGTIVRYDDTMAAFSSRGPTAVDFIAKPDVVAPGLGIVSLSSPDSTLYTRDAAFLLAGSFPSATMPYLSLSGTSMAAPMVAGTAALMIQANPNLTPNLVKAIIEYTAQTYGYSAITQGAGFLNSHGAVRLARYLRNPAAGSLYPSATVWSKTVIWGNHKLQRGVIKPAGNAWAVTTTWGSVTEADGDNIVWGTECATADCDNIVWGTEAMDADNIVWGTDNGDGENIVWGTSCDGAADCDNIVWGTMADADNVVWGTECGAADCENIVWGTSELENIVWGTSDGENIVWGTSSDDENIVWGTSSDIDNIVWGTATDLDNIVWGTSGEDFALFDDPSQPASFDDADFDSLFAPLTVDTSGTSTTTMSTTTTISGGLF